MHTLAKCTRAQYTPTQTCTVSLSQLFSLIRVRSGLMVLIASNSRPSTTNNYTVTARNLFIRRTASLHGCVSACVSQSKTKLTASTQVCSSAFSRLCACMHYLHLLVCVCADERTRNLHPGRAKWA